jgi:hypothetical protein
VKDLDLTLTDLTPEEFASIAAPTLLDRRRRRHRDAWSTR